MTRYAWGNPAENIAMPFGIGPLELVIVLIIILVIFGPKRLPQAGRSLGQGFREFKDSVTSKHDEQTEPTRAAEIPASEPPQAPAASAPAPTPAEAPPAEPTPAEASRAFGRDD